jgi:serine O-acetyltransferase
MSRPDNVARLNPAIQAQWNLDPVAAGLRVARERWRAAHQRERECGGRELLSREALEEVVHDLCGVLFPMRLGPPDLRRESEDYFVG